MVDISEKIDDKNKIENTWYTYLTKGYSTREFRLRRFFRHLPTNPRCRLCNAPFQGIGGSLVKMVFDKRPSNLNPHLCNLCEKFANEHQGGAEVELSLLFADVRGSTALAEGMSPMEYSQVINRFYQSVTDVLIESDALIDRLAGDQAIGLYVPGFAGKEHARRAVEAAQDIMQVTGHAQQDKAWIPLGIGVNTGIAFVGAVGSKDGTIDITVLGDAANTAARLSSAAADGEILISETTWEMAGLEYGQIEKHSLELKGKSEPVTAFALKIYTHTPSHSLL